MSILTSKQEEQLRNHDPDLTSLILRYQNRDDIKDFLQIFIDSKNKNVTTIGFYESELNDELLELLVYLNETAVNKLCLSDIDSNITDKGISHIANIQSLTHLEIAGNLSKDCLVKLFNDLPNLVTLEIYSRELSEEDFEPFLSKSNVKVFLNGDTTPLEIQTQQEKISTSPRLFSKAASIDNQDKEKMLKELHSLLSSDDRFRALSENLDPNLLKNFLQSAKAATKILELQKVIK